MKSFCKANLDPHLNTVFEVRPKGENRTARITLVAVSERSIEPYVYLSLLFTGSAEDVFPQDTHVVSHPAFGEFEMFIGPVRHPKFDGTCFEAVFSRLK